MGGGGVQKRRPWGSLNEGPCRQQRRWGKAARHSPLFPLCSPISGIKVPEWIENDLQLDYSCERKWNKNEGNSLGVQWLEHCASIAGGTGSTPGRGTEILQASLHGQTLTTTTKHIKEALALLLYSKSHRRMLKAGIEWVFDDLDH